MFKPWRRRRRDVNREPAPVVYRALVWLVRVVMPLVARRHWAGQEHIPATGPAIVVGNHISNFDPLVLVFYFLGALVGLLLVRLVRMLF